MKDNKMEIVRLSAVELPVMETTYRGGRGLDYVRFGANNDFPQKMIEYLSYSPTHSGIIKLKQNLVAGGGLINEKGEKLKSDIYKNEVNNLKQTTLDYAYLSGYAFQVRYSADGTMTNVQHIDYSRLRAEYSDTGNTKAYFYSNDWGNIYASRNKPVRIPVFNKKSVIGKDDNGNRIIKEARQIYVYYDKHPNTDYYPIPTYSPAFSAIEYENEYGIFKANTMENGMFPSVHLEIDGDPTDEEKGELNKYVRENLSGARKSGGVFITYKSGEDGEVKINPVSIDVNADQFTTWEDSAKAAIMTSHQLTSPTLAGISGGGNLSGNASELIVALENFQTIYVEPAQNTIAESLSFILGEEVKIEKIRPFTVFPEMLWDIMTSADIVKISKEMFGIELEGTTLQNDGELLPIKEGEDGEIVDIQKQALNAEQVSSMVDVVSQFNQGLISKESAISILKIAFQLSEEEAKEIVGEAVE